MIKTPAEWREYFDGIEETKLPIDTSGKVFRRRWFKNRNQKTFSTYLPPRFEGKEPMSLLQIGVFEGMDLLWQFQHTLKARGSFAVAVDPWMATRKLDEEFMEQARTNAVNNLNGHPVVWHRGFSQEKLPGFVEQQGYRFDLLIVDGDHRARAVIDDARNCLALAKPGAWILFDDVENRIEKKDHVKQGLAQFMANDGKGKMELVWKHGHCECFQVL